MHVYLVINSDFLSCLWPRSDVQPPSVSGRGALLPALMSIVSLLL